MIITLYIHGRVYVCLKRQLEGSIQIKEE